MIILNSIGLNTFKLELNDSLSWVDTCLGNEFSMKLKNAYSNISKELVWVSEYSNTDRTVSFQITGVSTAGAEDLSPPSGGPLVYFGTRGIGLYRWILSSDQVVTGPLDQGYLKVVSNSSGTTEVGGYYWSSANETLQNKIYTS